MYGSFVDDWKTPDEYISKKTAIEKIKEIAEQNYQGRYANIGMTHAAQIIEHFPAADVAPVVRGKWIFDGEWWEFRCTNCKGAIGNVRKYNYCPHCGSKMDGGTP